jgi:rhamnosyltransferase
MKKPLVSITFMFKDSGPILNEFLARIQSQKFEYPYEIVAMYFGRDKDDSLQKVKAIASKIKTVKYDKFDYGSARDLLCSISEGDYIIALSVDALPINDLWLQNMIQPLIQDQADVVQGKLQCPEKGDPNYPNFFFWEKDYGFYFTSEGKKFMQKHGSFGKHGFFGLAAPNLAFKKIVWEKAKFSGVRYNDDNIFQKRVSEHKFRTIYKDDAVVLHAHSYKNIKTLFYRCSNEGLGWKDVGESYDMNTMLKDMSRFDLHFKAGKAYLQKNIAYPSELLFHFIRPIGLYWGNHHAKSLYSDDR